MFQSVFESTLDLTTSLKSVTARLKYPNCDRVGRNRTFGAPEYEEHESVKCVDDKGDTEDSIAM